MQRYALIELPYNKLLWDVLFNVFKREHKCKLFTSLTYFLKWWSVAWECEYIICKLNLTVLIRRSLCKLKLLLMHFWVTFLSLNSWMMSTKYLLCDKSVVPYSAWIRLWINIVICSYAHKNGFDHIRYYKLFSFALYNHHKLFCRKKDWVFWSKQYIS